MSTFELFGMLTPFACCLPTKAPRPCRPAAAGWCGRRQGYRRAVPDDESTKDLVEDEGVNAGSREAERDREASRDVEVHPSRGAPSASPPPPERLVGPPEQGPCAPGQELAAGE